MRQLVGEIQRASKDKEQNELQANTEKDINRHKANEEATVLITKAKGSQNIIENEVKAQTISLLNKAKTEAQKLLINTDKQVVVMGIESNTENNKTKAEYESLIQECEAEEANLEAIEAQREHQF